MVNKVAKDLQTPKQGTKELRALRDQRGPGSGKLLTGVCGQDLRDRTDQGPCTEPSRDPQDSGRTRVPAPKCHDESPASTFIQMPSWEQKGTGSHRRKEKQPIGYMNVELTIPKR